MTKDILAQFMEPKEEPEDVYVDRTTQPVPGDEMEFNRLAIVDKETQKFLSDPQVIPASAPFQPTVTEEERRAQEARDYLASLPQRRQATPEEIEAERQATLATIPMANGRPVPESGTLTQEQMRNNPSNYVPAIEEYVQQTQAPAPKETPVVVTAASFAPSPQPAQADNRQWWVCVQSDGIRTLDNTGTVHPAFQSDVHLMDVMVRCPVCDSMSVRKVQPGEDLSQSEKAAQWTRKRTEIMGVHPLQRSLMANATQNPSGS